MEISFVDQGYTEENNAAKQVSKAGIELEVVKHTKTKKGIRVVAAWLGGRTHFRLVRTIPSTHTRLRTSGGSPRGLALAFLKFQNQYQALASTAALPNRIVKNIMCQTGF